MLISGRECVAPDRGFEDEGQTVSHSAEHERLKEMEFPGALPALEAPGRGVEG
jgi:hypothetical protein